MLHFEIIQAINDQKDSKSCGLDGIYAPKTLQCHNNSTVIYVFY